MKGFFKGVAGGSFFEADVEGGTGIAVGDVPHFGFGLAAEFGREMSGGMDLDGEIVPGIEDFDEEGETFAGEVGAEDFVTVVAPEIVQGFPGEGPDGDD